MIKKFFHIILFLFSFQLTFAQPYGNEWINYSQSYFKIKIYKEGVYRITPNTLQNAGININSIDPRSIQIFNNGVEQNIYISGENDGRLDAGDYIEFYGNKNSGWLDSALYSNPSWQANPNYSLFNDTAVYFLTFNSSINNKRMVIESDINFSAYPALPYFNCISRQDYTDHYFLGTITPEGIADPEYVAGEGWFDNGFTLGGSISKNLNTKNIYTSGPPVKISSILLGESNFQGANPNHHVRISFANKIYDTIFEGFTTIGLNYSIPTSAFSSTTNFTISSINDISGNQADRNTIPYISIKYPHTFQLENDTTFKMYIQDAPQLKSLLNISNFFVNTNDTVRLYDLTNHKRIVVIKNGNYYSALIPNTGTEKVCYITSDQQINTVTAITPVNTNISTFAKFTDYSSNNHFNSDYIIITHQSLMQGATQYMNYRNSTGYKTLLVNVDDIYDQYAYGIGKHPLGIRNFLHACYNKFTVKPKYLFLIGKGYRAGDDASIDNGVPFFRKNPVYYNATLIPTFGSPPSDVLFTTYFNDSLYKPALATGRLSAQKNDDVILYLNKVKEAELAHKQPAEWMKNILHFGGGTDASEQNTFKMYLDNYARIIQDTAFGGYVRSFFKTSPAPFQVNRSDSLKNIINNGVAMMTFFGHAAGIGFDESIDYPSDYNNQGKYPLLLANSCFAGDVFTDQISSSEAFVLIENKGAIAFLASITTGIDYYQNLFSNEFYKNIAYKNYGKSIGICIQQTIKNIEVNNFYVKDMIYEFLYHGDPAVALSSPSKPDYMITPSNVYFTPSTVTSDLQTFTINIISTNLGRAVRDSFMINVHRTFPDGSQSDTNIRVRATLFKDTIPIKMNVGSDKAVGINTFKITLNAWNNISEITFSNNTAVVNLQISSYDVLPVYPYEYAVIPANTTTLKAYTSDPFAPQRNYIFEIDTSALFLNPMARGSVSHTGGVVPWSPPVTFKDSIVYFWRVGIDSTLYGHSHWRESSFQYISGKRGWGQAHFFQFGDDNYKFIKYNIPQRSFPFVNNISVLNVQTGYYPSIQWQEEWFKLNGAIIDEWSCVGNQAGGMKFAAFDPVSGSPLSNSPGNQQNDYTGRFGSWQCKSYVTQAFDYFTQTYTKPSGTTVTQQQWFGLMKSFIDSVPVGSYVLAYSHESPNCQLYSPDLIKNLKSCGCQSVRNVPNQIPYICFGKKYNDTIHAGHEAIANSMTQIIQLNDSIVTKWNQGYIQSTLIGPAVKWNSLHWRTIPLERNPVTDTVKLKVIGIKNNGQVDTVIKNLPPLKDSIDILNLYNRIDAKVYPYLKLIIFMQDYTHRTPAYMKRWQVMFDGVPETAIDPSYYFSFYKDTVSEGDNIKLKLATRNISDYNFPDTIIIHYWLIDNSRVMHELGYKKTRRHPAGDILIDSISVSSIGLRGSNDLWAEVNPINPKTGLYYQLEQYHFNNIINKQFFVKKDNTNPLLDVTFDGVHILNDDIVSAKPEILMTLKDENKFLLLNDTSSFIISLQTPSGNIPQRIYFRNNGVENMQFYPATSLANNTCKIEWTPVFSVDGNYQLFVKAMDRSGNISGNGYRNTTPLNDFDFQIMFQVINKSTITEVLNWPNPFTTSTRFAFILTGSEIPTYFKIQIMTITGKIVREITQDEIGPIHIGRNITEYAWNGTDQFGDRLANGVYLYRVVTNIHGNSIERMGTEADKFFTKGWGKMYLMK